MCRLSPCCSNGISHSCVSPEGLPFERACNYVPPEHEDDPSPWPEVFVGVIAGRVVAVLQARRSWAPATRACTPLPAFEGPRPCTAPGVPQRVHRTWARRWSTVFQSAS